MPWRSRREHAHASRVIYCALLNPHREAPMVQAYVVTNGHSVRVPATEARTPERCLERVTAWANSHFQNVSVRDSFVRKVVVR